MNIKAPLENYETAKKNWKKLAMWLVPGGSGACFYCSLIMSYKIHRSNCISDTFFVLNCNEIIKLAIYDSFSKGKCIMVPGNLCSA